MRRAVPVGPGTLGDACDDSRGGSGAADDPEVGDLDEGFEAGAPEPVLVGGLGDDGDSGLEEHAEGVEEGVHGRVLPCHGGTGPSALRVRRAHAQPGITVGASCLGGYEYARPVEDREEYVRYQQDRTVLAAVGAHLGPQIGPITVRLPRSVAESAVAAWDRDELGGVGEETRGEYELRHDAAELAFIGLAISSSGVWEGGEVVVDLDVVQIASALRAAW